MTTATLLRKVEQKQHVQVGKIPMVVLPLALWEEIQDQLEDLEISKSRYLKKSIAQSRREIAQGKTISLSDLVS